MKSKKTMEVHDMEPSKLEEKEYDMSDPLVRWLLFISGAPRETWEELAKDTPGLKKAMDTLEALSQDERICTLAAAREEVLHSEMTESDWARKKEYKIQVAKDLLNREDISTSDISEVTELSESEIEKLKEQVITQAPFEQ
jgi:hypothetical protein